MVKVVIHLSSQKHFCNPNKCISSSRFLEAVNKGVRKIFWNAREGKRNFLNTTVGL